MTTLQIALTVLAGVAALWLVVLIVRDVEPNDYVYGVLALLEIGLLAQLVIGLVMIGGDHGGVNVAAYVGYLVGSIVLLPVAFLWSVGERSRAGTGVLLVAVLVVPVLFLRLHQLWAAR
ncbi:MAG TPA: hypothetical protein VHR35_17545 [Nocardioides sp.]|nr:hypothetical protein [Nocardioides sp.]